MDVPHRAGPHGRIRGGGRGVRPLQEEHLQGGWRDQAGEGQRAGRVGGGGARLRHRRGVRRVQVVHRGERQDRQGSAQLSRLSSQFAFHCRNLPQLLNTYKNVPFHLNLHINLQFLGVQNGFHMENNTDIHSSFEP